MKGNFTLDNWCCKTIRPLKYGSFINKNGLSKLVLNWETEDSIKIIPTDEGFIILKWYKDRGRVENAYFLSDKPEDGIRNLNIKDLEEFEIGITK